MNCGVTCICARIRVALERHRSDGAAVRGIYLTPDDRKSLDECESERFGMKIRSCSFDEIPLREGKRSAVYSQFGVAKAVKRELSRRVA